MFVTYFQLMDNARFLWKGLVHIIKELVKSIREYKKQSIITPLLITFEVVIQCIIPFITATLVNQIKNGCGLDTIIKYGIILVIMAILSLTFGGWG